MGVVSSKLTLLTGEGIEGTVVNHEKSGDIYIVLYQQLPCGNDLFQHKRAHFSIVVDVEGRSTNETLCGQQFHLGADTTTRAIKFISSYLLRERSSLYAIYHLGRIENISHEDPLVWSLSLSRDAATLFTQTFQGQQWSSHHNCQSFAKQLAERWGIDWDPVIVLCGEEEVPVIIDIAILMAVS